MGAFFDDRGYRLRKRAGVRAMARGLDWREATRYQTAVNESTPRWASALWASAPVVVLIPLFSVGASLVTGRGPGLAGVALLAVLSAGGFAGIWLATRGPRFEGLRAGGLAVGRCPGCGHSLITNRNESDGCTVCPECGAAWRVG